MLYVCSYIYTISVLKVGKPHYFCNVFMGSILSFYQYKNSNQMDLSERNAVFLETRTYLECFALDLETLHLSKLSRQQL